MIVYREYGESSFLQQELINLMYGLANQKLNTERLSSDSVGSRQQYTITDQFQNGLNPLGPSSSSFHSVTPSRPATASAPSAAHQLNHSTPSRTAAPQSHMLASPAD